MTKGLKAVGIGQGTHYGYHSRRHFATAYKHLPIADLCALGRRRMARPKHGSEALHEGGQDDYA